MRLRHFLFRARPTNSTYERLRESNTFMGKRLRLFPIKNPFPLAREGVCRNYLFGTEVSP